MAVVAVDPRSTATSYSTKDAATKIKGLIDECEYTEAAELLEEYRKHVPENDGVVSTIFAVLCFHRKDYERALQHALFAVELEQGHWAAFNCSARCYIALGELDSAVKMLDRLNGEHPESELLDRTVQTQLDHFRKQAADLLEEATILVKQRDDLKRRISKGKVARALKIANQLCRTCPASTEMFILRIEVNLGLRQFEKVLSDLAQLDEEVSSEPRVLRLTGQVMLYTGHLTEARGFFAKAAANSSDPDAARLTDTMRRMDEAHAAAKLALDNKHYEEAHKLCTDALLIDRNVTQYVASMYALRAKVHMARHEAAAAIADATLAIETQPTDAAMYEQRATFFASLAEWGLAVRDWRLASVKNPHNSYYQEELRRAQAEDELARSTDHYAILGVSPAATISEIRSAYHQLVLANHPDHCPKEQTNQAHFRCRRYIASWAVLNDPDKRAAFDLERQKASRPVASQQLAAMDDVLRQLSTDDTAPLL